jgi:hypothetical protein
MVRGYGWLRGFLASPFAVLEEAAEPDEASILPSLLKTAPVTEPRCLSRLSPRMATNS